MKVPKHLAIILDGNRRLAKKLMVKPWKGHEWGAKKVEKLLDWASGLGIKELTLYAFSIDNFDRSKQEKKVLFSLFEESIKKLKNDKGLDKNGIKVRFIGRLHMFPENIQKEMYEVMERTKNNNNSKLNFAMAYSSKAEITDALKKIIQKLKNKEIKEEYIDEELIKENLYLSSSPDILIRPGGEKRISDFLLWQISYSELFFIDKLWPEFTKQDLIHIIKEFSQRERRFGR